MRSRSLIVPVVLAFAIPVVPAIARTTGAASASQVWYRRSPAVITSHNGNLTIADARRDRAFVLSQLQEPDFANGNDTMEQERDGGCSMGGSAGGAGAC